jgi:FAD/FMN-containing dehydrogenase
VHITKDNKDLFDAARNGLGCLGVVSTVTLQCVPAFQLEKTTQVVPLDQVASDVTNRVNSNEYFSFWYVPHANQANLFIANKVDRKEKSAAAASPVEKYKALAIKYGTAYAFAIVYKIIFSLTVVLEFLTPTFLNIFIATLKKSQTTQKSYHALFESFAEVLPAWSEVEYFVPLENAGAVLKEV